MQRGSLNLPDDLLKEVLKAKIDCRNVCWKIYLDATEDIHEIILELRLRKMMKDMPEAPPHEDELI
jgi:hypothetical protein